VILDSTEPPKLLGQSEYQWTAFQIAKLPNEKLKPLFDDIQWRLVRRQLDQFQVMEAVLLNRKQMQQRALFGGQPALFAAPADAVRANDMLAPVAAPAQPKRGRTVKKR
jgi:hypothetical protein